MAKILMAWELGGGPGALGRLGAIAGVLTADGHEVVFVVRNLVQPANFFSQHGYAAYQAPDWRAPVASQIRASQISGYADVLAASGFFDEPRIAAILGAWDSLIDYIRPDIAVADSSPALTLAARGKFPVISVGDGFMLPPHETNEFPTLLPKVRPALAQANLLESINSVLEARRAPPLGKLPDMMKTEADFVLSLAALDPYAEVRAHPAVGPIEPLADTAPPATGRGVFAALDAGFPGAQTVMAGFVRSELPVMVYLRGAAPEFRRKFQNRNVRLVDQPPANAVDDAAVVVHHGSIGAATQSLAAGRAQCVVPIGLESHLTGQILMKLGVGAMIPIKQSADHIGSALGALAADRDVAERASALAAGLERPAPGEVLGRVVEGCRTLLGAPAS